MNKSTKRFISFQELFIYFNYQNYTIDLESQ